MAELATILLREPPREQVILKMIAFLGRYGRQPASEVLRLPITFVIGLMREVGELMKDEKPEA